MGGGGGGGETERPICIGADKPSCYPKAEVETIQPGLFSSYIYIYIYIYVVFNLLKLYFVKRTTIFSNHT